MKEKKRMNHELESFRDIELQHKDFLNSYFYKYNCVISSYNFANLFMWGRLHKYKWSLFQGRIVIYTDIDHLAVMPLGEPVSASDILHLSDALISQGRKGNFSFVPVDFVDKNRELLENHFHIESDENNADYVYSTKKLFELSGKKLQKKKNLLSQFQRQYPNYACHRINQDHFDECIDLNEKWCEDKSCKIVSFAYETEALRVGCSHCHELELDGLIILVQDQVIAFTVFNRQNENMALVHFEKYDREIKGAGQAINWEAAKYLKDQYEFVNREQDLGIEGLRQAKQSYTPEYLVLTYRLTRKL